ncbi:MAG: hypothetical protein RSC98_03440 [Clostridia bacterium]
MKQETYSPRSDTPPPPPKPEDLPFKERMYSKVKIPLKTLDVIIWVLAAAIVVCIAIGALKGNGVI